MDPEFLLLVASFFVIATVYSSAGFGGGSSYLAVLSVALHEYSQMRTIALVCNLVVVLGSVWLFWKAGQWSWRLAAPLLALSVPMAYLGASLSLNPEAFFGLLGGALIAAAVAMVVQEQRLAHVTDRSPGRSGAIAFS